MWPWEHFAVGYVAVSLLFRIRGTRVDTGQFLAVALGSQFPDLVDKPLAWAFEVLPSGMSFAHSVFVALPLSFAVWTVCARGGYRRLGLAFAIAYLLHLPADIFYGTITTGEPPSFGPVLWPIVSNHPYTDPNGLIEETLSYFRRYVNFLLRAEAYRYILIEVGLLLTTALLWVLDGRPGSELLDRSLEKLDPYH